MNFLRAIELLDIANTNIQNNIMEMKKKDKHLPGMALAHDSIKIICVKNEFKKISLVDFTIKDLTFNLRQQNDSISAHTRLQCKTPSGLGCEVLISLFKNRQLNLSFTRYKTLNSFPIDLLDYTYTSNYIENLEKLLDDKLSTIQEDNNNTNPHTKKEITNHNNAVFCKAEVSLLKMILDNIK